MLDKSKIHIPTDEEDQEITKGIKEAPEAYELDNSTLTHMQPAEDVVPEVVKSFRARGKQKSPTKKATTIRLSPEVLEYFKSTGKGWQTRIDIILKDYVSSH